jgi:peptidoglycan hydrolase CwlO-like protein
MTENDQLPEEQLPVEGVVIPETSNMEVIEAEAVVAEAVVEEQVAQPEPVAELEAEVAEPETEVTEPEAEVAEPETEVTEPEAEVSEPEAEVAEPEAEIAEPEAEIAEPEAEIAEPEAEIAEPEAEVAEPESGISETTEESVLPELDEDHDDEGDSLEEHLASKIDQPTVIIDYSSHSRQELLEALYLLLTQRPIHEITRDVENIRSTFYRKLKNESEERHKKFIEEGGVEEEYKPAPDPLEEGFKASYEQYRIKRGEYSRALEGDKEGNLKKKLEIIDHIKNLLNTQESLNRTFNEFRELQRQWRDIGPVPQTDLHSLWENYHHHVERFYDYIKINKELRDLDLKKNLEIKIQICEKAEVLLLEPSVIKSFGELQQLHNQWREVGPVPSEKKDEIWDRFREATNQINRKHQDYYLNLKDEQKKNLDAKTHLCDKIEEILQKAVQNPKDWNEFSLEVVKLQQMWRSIGFAPRKDNNKVYDRFRAGCDEFFNRKREYFSKHRDDQHGNLQMKTDLCMQAESLSNSTEWRKTTDELVTIQKKWKEIGPVPRKYSDPLWHRFRAACDAFFKKKSEFFSSQDSEQIENLKLKLELVEKVKSFSLSDNHYEDLMALKTIQKDFTSIGHIPIEKKDEVQKEFREAIHKLFDQLEVDEPRKEILRYKQKVDTFVQSPKNRNRISSEREKLVNKLKQMESDVVLWENNIGFFAKSQKSESLIREVESKIAQERERIQLLKEKIDLLDRTES